MGVDKEEDIMGYFFFAMDWMYGHKEEMQWSVLKCDHSHMI